MSQRTQYTLTQRVRYRLDNALTRGVGVILAWLGLAMMAFIAAVAVVAWVWSIGPDDERVPFLESAWLALTRTLDPGTFGGDTGTRFRLLMLAVTLVGVLVFATIIGLVSNSIDRRLELLRQGKSLVVETGHTLILGYSPKVPAIVSELVVANLHRRNPAIVLLSDVAPDDVHDALSEQGVQLRNTRLVVRRGNPASIEDLARMNAVHARSIIVLAPSDGTADSVVVKQTLALKRLGVDFAQTPVIAEVSDSLVSAALSEIGGPGLLTVNPLGTVARITARVLRTSGLGLVYEDMLDFEGDEIYTVDVPDAYVGQPFGALLLASSQSCVIGLVRDGGVLPVPDFAEPVRAGDRAVVISADDDTLALDRAPEPVAAPTSQFEVPRRPERMLMIGWSRLGAAICQDNEAHVLEGSRVTVIADPALHDAAAIAASLVLTRQELVVVPGSQVNRHCIDTVLSEGDFDHVLVLAERDGLSAQDADARALLALLHVRAWLDAQPSGVRRPNLVGELLDANDEVIGEVARPDDFIVSERIVSLAISQLSRNPSIYPVLRRLMEADGVQLGLVTREDLPNAKVATFADLVTACRSVGVIAIGYQSGVGTGGDLARASIHVNPDKSAPLELGPDDKAVVMMRTG